MDCVDIKEKNENHGDLAPNPCIDGPSLCHRPMNVRLSPGAVITVKKLGTCCGPAGVTAQSHCVQLSLIAKKRAIGKFGSKFAKIGQKWSSGSLCEVQNGKFGQEILFGGVKGARKHFVCHWFAQKC